MLLYNKIISLINQSNYRYIVKLITSSQSRSSVVESERNTFTHIQQRTVDESRRVAQQTVYCAYICACEKRAKFII